MKKLPYDKFMEIIPIETKKLVAKAIEVYQLFDYYKILKQNDRMALSFFLAGLLVDGEIKDIFENYNIGARMVFDFLNQAYENPEELLPKEYEEFYNQFFQKYIYRIIDRQKELKSEEFLIPEVLVSTSCYKFDCESEIVDEIYRYKDLGNDAFTHPSFSTIRILAHDKLKQLPSVAVNDDSQNKGSKNLQKSFINKGQLEFFGGLGENLNCREFLNNPALGREQELKDLMVALITPEMSAVIVGEAGTGKTALVEGLVYRINNGDVPNVLKDKQIVKVNVNSLVAGTIYRGQFEEKIEKVLQEASKNPNIIIFFDEMHTAINAGSCSSNLDLANILKPYLDRGEVKVIGATTKEEYEQYIMSDEAFKRRFERVDILEPNEAMVADILNKLIPKLEKVTGVSFPFETIDAVELTEFLAKATDKKNRNHTDNVNNPDLAIKIFSKAFALATYENAREVKPEHIAESIRRSARLNEASRMRLADILLAKFSSPKPKKGCQIIEFPRR
ncbi:MAG: AAA family ATPase [Ruminococcus sp.]|nr:AAA family ATPase [Ruminococcus sp.]